MNDSQQPSYIETTYKDDNNRLGWHQYFANIAVATSQRSPCQKLKVGCVIVSGPNINGNSRILTCGYNGFLPNLLHISMTRNGHEIGTVHAEQNAIASAAKCGVSIKDSIAYVTHFPCINCYKILASCGIRCIYYIHDYKNDDAVNALQKQESAPKIYKIEEKI